MFFPKKGFLREEEMEGSDGTREDTEDTTMLLQIEEVMSAIGALPIVTKLSPVGAKNRARSTRFFSVTENHARDP